ncbi:MAG: aldo/keto reductase [Bacteroidota bacterium]|nr:aldo/keto reductase [Bacteroidota bacterium]
MKYRKLGRTGLDVSLLGFGALEIGRNWPYWRREKEDFIRPSETDAIKVIHSALDQGINFFDTAPAYFQSEEILGKAFKGIRKNVLIATKCGEWFDGEKSVYNYSYSETKKFIENSLKLLRTDYIDLLQIHSANADIIRNGETLAAMKDVQKEGKVRFIGLSTDFEDAALLAIESKEYDSIQISHNAINLLMSKNVFPLAQKSNIGIIIKDGMARGMLSPKYSDIADSKQKETIEQLMKIAQKNDLTLSELAISYVISSLIVSSVIVGTKKIEHLYSNVSVIQRPLLSHDTLNAIAELNL